LTTDVLAALRTYLQNAGISEPIYLQHRPATAEDTCVLLRDYGDAAGPSWSTEGRVQALVRGPQGDVKAAKDLAQEVHAVLWPANVPGMLAGSPNPVAVTVGGSQREMLVWHLSGPIDLGADEAGRFEFSTNYRMLELRR